MKQKTIIEIVSTASIVASLIFVGVQVQQGAAATRSATVLQLKASWVQLNLATATSLDLTKAFVTVRNKGFGVDENADGLVAGLYRALLHNWSNAYYQYENGTLEEAQWLPHLREMKATASDPILLKIWPEWKHVFDDHFQSLLDDILTEPDE